MQIYLYIWDKVNFDYYNFLYYNFSQSVHNPPVSLQSTSTQYHTFVILDRNIVQIDPSANIKILFSSSVFSLLLLFLFYSHGETD